MLRVYVTFYHGSTLMRKLGPFTIPKAWKDDGQVVMYQRIRNTSSDPEAFDFQPGEHRCKIERMPRHRP